MLETNDEKNNNCRKSQFLNAILKAVATVDQQITARIANK